MSVTAYFDASGSPSTDAVAVAGLAATPEKWVEFERKWDECLTAQNVSALHMRDFAHCRREFESWKDDEPRRRRLLNGLLWIIEETIDYSVACAIYMNDYNAVDASRSLSETMRPYTMASLTCSACIIPWAQNNGHQRDQIIWVFEKGDDDQDDLRKHWDWTYPNSDVEPIMLKKRDGYPDPNQCRAIRAFEAADLVAYENLLAHKKLQRLELPIYIDQLRKPIQRMHGLPGADDWRFFEKDDIQKFCSMHGIAERP